VNALPENYAPGTLLETQRPNDFMVLGFYIIKILLVYILVLIKKEYNKSPPKIIC
jgi:hypothetical protein